MVVLIDGYNVIKYILSHHHGEHDGQRAWLINKMAAYKKAQTGRVNEIIVVFDGGMARHRQREMVSGIAVVFAGHTYSADDVIVQYAERFHVGCVVVSNDRELQRRAAAHHAEHIKVDDFFALIGAVEHVYAPREQHFGQVTITKLDDEHEDAALDELMIAASIGGVHKPDAQDQSVERASGKRVSKKERARQRLYKKLGK